MKSARRMRPAAPRAPLCGLSSATELSSCTRRVERIPKVIFYLAVAAADDTARQLVTFIHKYLSQCGSGSDIFNAARDITMPRSPASDTQAASIVKPYHFL